MKWKLIKYINRYVLFVFAFVSLVFIFMIAYGYVEFYPTISEIKSILHESNHLYKEPPKALLKLAVLSEGENRIASYVASRLLLKSGYNHPGILKWTARYTLWTTLLKFHFNDIEIFTLWCYFAPYEAGQGLNDSAQYYYKRNLDELNNEELATVILIARNPSLYKWDPVRFKSGVAKLLEKLAGKR